MSVRRAELGDAEGVLAVWAQARSAAAVTPDTPESVALAVEQGARSWPRRTTGSSVP